MENYVLITIVKSFILRKTIEYRVLLCVIYKEIYKKKRIFSLELTILYGEIINLLKAFNILIFLNSIYISFFSNKKKLFLKKSFLYFLKKN